MDITLRAERCLVDYDQALTKDEAAEASADLRRIARLLIAEIRELRRSNEALRILIAPSLTSG